MDYYSSTIDTLVARVLSMQNRNPLSSSFGCFDRNFWHFKTIIDFPSATYQQVVMGLSKLHSEHHKNNQYYNDPTIKKSIKSGIIYWCKIQNSDGSQNEYYENDRSFCPSAFTTYATAKAFIISKDLFSSDEQDLIINKLKNGASWLATHTFPEVQNQMIASMNALYYVSEITQDIWIKDAFKKRRKDVLSAQDEEGWFPEYDGADIGYCFKALDLLCSYLFNCDDGDVFNAATKLAEFMSAFLHPDGTAGGSYGSRCTEHVFPFGIEFLSRHNVLAAKYILKWFRKHDASGKVINPAFIDDKYALYFYFNSYVQAFLLDEKTSDEDAVVDIDWPKVKRFDNAGLLRYQKEDIVSWWSWKRKGVGKIFKDDRLIFSDTGYLFQLSNGDLCASQTTDEHTTIECKEGENHFSIVIKGYAGKFDDSLPLKKWIIPFKLFCKTILRSNKIGYWFNQLLKQSRIKKQHRVPVTMRRELILTEDKIELIDTLEIESSNLKFKKIEPLRDVTTVHSPSSRFYQAQYLIPDCKLEIITESHEKYIYKYEVNY